jgi:DNA-binding MarR family transcriptional regulator
VITAASPQDIREQLLRQALASARQRAVLGRLLGVSESDVLALQHLARAERLTPGQLGDLLQLTSGGTTALVHRLERHGHVVREPHPTDGRSTLIAPTPAIAERATESLSPLVREIDRLAAQLSDGERLAVGRFLTAVADAGERHVDELLRRVRDDRADDHGVATPEPWA